jgi:arginine repressor
MSLEDSLHFYDSHHLNQKGVEIFSTKVARDIDFLKLLKN